MVQTSKQTSSLVLVCLAIYYVVLSRNMIFFCFFLGQILNGAVSGRAGWLLLDHKHNSKLIPKVLDGAPSLQRIQFYCSTAQCSEAFYLSSQCLAVAMVTFMLQVNVRQRPILLTVLFYGDTGHFGDSGYFLTYRPFGIYIYNIIFNYSNIALYKQTLVRALKITVTI